MYYSARHICSKLPDSEIPEEYHEKLSKFITRKVPKVLKAGVWERWMALESDYTLDCTMQVCVGRPDSLPNGAKWAITADCESGDMTNPVCIDIFCTAHTFTDNVDDALKGAINHADYLSKESKQVPVIEARVFYALTMDSACFWYFWLKRMPIMSDIQEFNEYLEKIPHYGLYLATLNDPRLSTSIFQVLNATGFHEDLMDKVRSRRRIGGKNPRPFFFTAQDDSLIYGRVSLFEAVEFECTKDHILVSEMIEPMNLDEE